MKTLPSVELTDAQKMAAAAREYAANQGWAISVSWPTNRSRRVDRTYARRTLNERGNCCR